MDSVMIDRKILPDTINFYTPRLSQNCSRNEVSSEFCDSRHIFEKIRLVKENGVIILSPVFDKYAILKKSYGMFADGKLSRKRFMQEKNARDSFSITQLK